VEEGSGGDEVMLDEYVPVGTGPVNKVVLVVVMSDQGNRPDTIEPFAIVSCFTDCGAGVTSGSVECIPSAGVSTVISSRSDAMLIQSATASTKREVQ
jgi:hypothetical protein